jgi:hypothetical protein
LNARDDPHEFALTDDEVVPMRCSAAFSPCRNYRYSLSRFWNPTLPSILFVGLNPSTADDQKDDPTVRRCIGFARSWNFGGLILVNLFAYRSTDPSALLEAEDPIGPANDRHILAGAAVASLVVLAWGARGGLLDRDQQVLSFLPNAHCLGTTKDGHPKHPLYLAGSTRLRLFCRRSSAA